jgi:hypothetical protein
MATRQSVSLIRPTTTAENPLPGDCSEQSKSAVCRNLISATISPTARRFHTVTIRAGQQPLTPRTQVELLDTVTSDLDFDIARYDLNPISPANKTRLVQGRMRLAKQETV